MRAKTVLIVGVALPVKGCCIPHFMPYIIERVVG